LPPLTELDEGMLHWGLLAAAHRLPFLPIRAGLGSSVLEVNPGLRTVRSPYGDGAGRNGEASDGAGRNGEARKA
jgi:acyl CoA:acetate/3-ketoacid CoA transferase alpha subunit